ncbi:MAG: hypothetical protein SOZ83_05810 [Sphaerochaetaceae bacterium]|nr:hypothetical protein [Sphaerochaetaceae bacterium]
MMNIEITHPVATSIIRRDVKSIVSSPKVVSIVDSNVSIDTQAAARLIALEAEYTGLLYLWYFTMLVISFVKAVKVFAAAVLKGGERNEA